MSRRVSLLIFLLFGWSAAANLFAQSPAKPVASSSSPMASATPQASSTPTTKSLVDSMDPTDLKEAIQLLKNNYIKPQALNETELNRATFEGILTRLGRGVILLADSGAEAGRTRGPVFRRDSGGSHWLPPARSPRRAEPRGSGRASANFCGRRKWMPW